MPKGRQRKAEVKSMSSAQPQANAKAKAKAKAGNKRKGVELVANAKMRKVSDEVPQTVAGPKWKESGNKGQDCPKEVSRDEAFQVIQTFYVSAITKEKDPRCEIWGKSEGQKRRFVYTAKKSYFTEGFFCLIVKGVVLFVFKMK